MANINLAEAHVEFSRLKTKEAARNQEYFLLRQAVKGNFRWPKNWPTHIEKRKHNLCKPITERFATFLMGKGFTFNVERPNTVEYREKAERTEKILRRLLDLSNSQLQFDLGAITGTQLGRTIFKVYRKGIKGREHACFTYCQPDYFYGVQTGDNHVGEYSVVYYSYPMDVAEAKRLFGNRDYKTEAQLSKENYYDTLPEEQLIDADQVLTKARRVPVFEAWTKEAYCLEVGGQVIFNGDNPYKWSDTGEGFIPYVVIDNITGAGDSSGESDIAQSRELNEALNFLLSRKDHIVGRWLQPTLVWEGAPQNYAEVLAATIGGGGAIPARLGSRLYFLAYDRPNPAVSELEQGLRQAILEVAGMSELALQGTLQGSVNTGPSVNAQYQPVLATIDKKRLRWEAGLEILLSMLLQVQEDIGASKALGQAVVSSRRKSADAQPVQAFTPDQEGGAEDQSTADANEDGVLVQLSGKDISGLREVDIQWPGVLPKDDIEAARFELEKLQSGVQSFYTTLENLGEDYPDDEIARIRMENTDPGLRGEKVNEAIRAQTPLINKQADLAAQAAQAQAQQQGGPGAGPGAPDASGLDQLGAAGAPDEQQLIQQGDFGARLREMKRRSAKLDMSGDEPTITSGAGY